METCQLAVLKVYRPEQLKGGQDEGHAPALPEDYAKIAKGVAEKQAALSGYRLADEIAKYVAVN